MTDDRERPAQAGRTGAAVPRRRGHPDGLAGRKRMTRASDAFKAEEIDAFLDMLARTCCVEAAAAATGRTAEAFHTRRRRDPDLADRWRQALIEGYDTLEAKLLRFVLDEGRGVAPSGTGADADTDTDGGTAEAGIVLSTRFRSGVGEVTRGVQAGMMLLNRHRAGAIEGRARQKSRPATAAETDALLNKRLDMLARSMARGG